MLRRRPAAEPSGLFDLPGYTEISTIGVGSSGVVCRAYQPRLDRWVAVKIIQAELSGNDLEARWERECRATGRLSRHPAIVTLLDAGVTAGGRPYLVMDYYPQGSLAAKLARDGPMTPAEVLRLGVKLCGALETAHRLGIYHRDVKPENVLVSEFGEPALADFGIAGLAGSATASIGPRALTPVHAAPEVLDDQPATPRSDVYALGSVLYTALAGRPAYQPKDGEGLAALLARIVRQPLPPMGRRDVPADVEEAMAWAMSRDPSERPGSAATFGQRLQQLQVQLGEPPTELVITAEATGSATYNEIPRAGEATIQRLARRDPEIPLPPLTSQSLQTTPPDAAIVPAGTTGTVARPARSGRVPEASPAPSRRDGRQWLWWVAAAVAGVAVAVVAVVVAGAAGRKATPPATTVEVNQALAPTGLSIIPLGASAVELRWTDHAGGRYPFVVRFDPPLNGLSSDHTAVGQAFYLVTNLQSGQHFCFDVQVAVSGDQRAWPTSTQACRG